MFENSQCRMLKENVVNFEFFRKFEVSLCLKKITNLSAKDAKRSVKMWTTSFCNNFCKNILLNLNGRLQKIRLVHTVNNKKKTHTPCFSTLSFSRISQEPLELKKIYLHLFMSVFKELSAEHKNFSNLMTQSADIGNNVNFPIKS